MLVPYPAQAESEREFSKLRNTLTYLRNRLGHDKIFKLSAIRSKLQELYSSPSAPRSEANIAADATRVQSAANTRRQSLTAAYAAIPANPAGVPAPPDDADGGVINLDVDDFGNGEMVGDEDYEPEAAIEELLRDVAPDEDFEAPANAMDLDGAPSPSTRANNIVKPRCVLSPVYHEIHQYIATFENLGERSPPPYKRIFGHRSVHIENIIPISIAPVHRWHIVVTAKAKRKFPGVRNLMRELGELIDIKDDMYDPPRE